MPPVGRYKHICVLEMDASLVKIISPNKIFTTYRTDPTIQDLLVSSKLTITVNRYNQYLKDVSNGVAPCKEGFKVCKDFLESPTNIISYQTDQ